MTQTLFWTPLNAVKFNLLAVSPTHYISSGFRRAISFLKMPHYPVGVVALSRNGTLKVAESSLYVLRYCGKGKGIGRGPLGVSCNTDLGYKISSGIIPPITATQGRITLGKYLFITSGIFLPPEIDIPALIPLFFPGVETPGNVAWVR